MLCSSPISANTWPKTGSRDGSLAGMAEQCNGSGVCRKLDEGVMCPSYRVTREEMHSTRGRANLIREHLRADNEPGRPGLQDVAAALDLCLSCKACASESLWNGAENRRADSSFIQASPLTIVVRSRSNFRRLQNLG